jgi:hypothetical protein
MSIFTQDTDLEQVAQEVAATFARALGISSCRVPSRTNWNGDVFEIRRRPKTPHYMIMRCELLKKHFHFRGLLGLTYEHERNFPRSLEADVLQTIITRETRRVVQRERVGPLSLARYRLSESRGS